jgi:single-strand DNA-binding protein
MQNIFIDEGNLGFDPSLKYVPVVTDEGTEQRAVVELQVRFDVKKYSAKTERHEDVSGFWGRVTMWGKRAEYAHAHLKKGCRILVVGEISQHAYVVQKGDRKGQDATALEINASHIGVVLLGVEEIVFAEKKPRPDDDRPYEANADADTDSIPFDYSDQLDQ